MEHKILIDVTWIVDYMLITFIIGLVGGWLIGYNTKKTEKTNTNNNIKTN